MTRRSLTATSKRQQTIEFVRKDTILRNMLTRSPQQIMDWWSTATNAEKDAVMLRVLIVTAQLLRRELAEE